MTNQIFNHADGQTVTFRMDNPEAKGDVIVRMTRYGLEVYLADVSTEDAVVFIDLYHTSPIGRNSTVSRGKPEVMLHDPGSDEPVAVVYYPDNRMSLFISPDLKPVERTFVIGKGEDGEDITHTQTELVLPEEAYDETAT